MIRNIFHQLPIVLEGCIGASNQNAQNDLVSLYNKMIGDYDSRWEESHRTQETRVSDTNHQFRIHAHLYWESMYQRFAKS